MTETPNTGAREMTIKRYEALELETLAAKLRADISRFSDRWARHRPRSRGPVQDPAARETLLVRYFALVLLGEKPSATMKPEGA